MSAPTVPIALFRLGKIVATPNALAQLSPEDILAAIQRHQAGDWGEVAAEDRQQNELALREGLRLFSVYHAANGAKFWLITEADRSATYVELHVSGLQESKSLQRTDSRPPMRMLKIEADGDFWKGLIKPRIRLVGRWLERAGFKAGNRVRVRCVAPGVIELHSADAFMVNEPKQPSSGQPECPF